MFHLGLWGFIIKSVSYEPTGSLMEVELLSGDLVIQYENVPEKVWNTFIRHPIPEMYYIHEIQGLYHVKRQ